MLFRIISIIRKIILFFTIFLIYNGFKIISSTRDEMLYMYANMTTFTFWVIFLMGAIFLAPVGRVFCALCPVGEINYLFSKIGKKIKFKLNVSFLQGISMLIIFILVINFHISKHPHYTSLLILITFILAGITGLLFRGNFFCINICPANGFLKFYSKFSFLKIVCDKNTKTGSECMVFLNPCNHHRENCHLCLRCFDKSESLKIGIRKPEITEYTYSKQDFSTFSILFGLTLMAFIRVVREIRETFVYPPYMLSQFLNIDEKYLIYLVILFGVLIYPVCLMLFIGFIKKIFLKGDLKKTIDDTITQLILPLFSIHFIISFIKLNARLGFIPYIFSDPSGKDTVLLYTLKKISIPNDIIPISLSRYIIFFIPVFFLMGWYLLFLKGKKIAKREFINLLTVLLFFTFIEYCIIMWLFKSFL